MSTSSATAKGIYSLPPVRNGRITLESLVLYKPVQDANAPRAGHIYKRLPYEPKHFIEGPKLERAPDPLRASIFSHEYDRCWSAEHAKRMDETKLPPVPIPEEKQKKNDQRILKIKNHLGLAILAGQSQKSKGKQLSHQQQRLSQMSQSFSTPVLQRGPGMTQTQSGFSLDDYSNSFQSSASYSALPSAADASQSRSKERKLSPEESQSLIERLSKPRRPPREVLNLPAIERHGDAVVSANAGNLDMQRTLLRLKAQSRGVNAKYKMIDTEMSKMLTSTSTQSFKKIKNQTAKADAHAARFKQAFLNHLVSQFGNLDEAWARALDTQGEGAIGMTTFVAACGRQGLAFNADMKLLFKSCADTDGLVTFNSLCNGYTFDPNNQEKPKMLPNASPTKAEASVHKTQKQSLDLPEIAVEGAHNVPEPKRRLPEIADQPADSVEQNHTNEKAAEAEQPLSMVEPLPSEVEKTAAEMVAQVEQTAAEVKQTAAEVPNDENSKENETPVPVSEATGPLEITSVPSLETGDFEQETPAGQHKVPELADSKGFSDFEPDTPGRSPDAGVPGLAGSKGFSDFEPDTPGRSPDAQTTSHEYSAEFESSDVAAESPHPATGFDEKAMMDPEASATGDSEVLPDEAASAPEAAEPSADNDPPKVGGSWMERIGSQK